MTNDERDPSNKIQEAIDALPDKMSNQDISQCIACIIDAYSAWDKMHLITAIFHMFAVDMKKVKYHKMQYEFTRNGDPLITLEEDEEQGPGSTDLGTTMH